MRLWENDEITHSKILMMGNESSSSEGFACSVELYEFRGGAPPYRGNHPTGAKHKLVVPFEATEQQVREKLVAITGFNERMEAAVLEEGKW